MISCHFQIQILIKKGIIPPTLGPKKMLLEKKDLYQPIEILFLNRVKGEAVLQASQNWFLTSMPKMVKIFQIAHSLIPNQARNSKRTKSR